MTLTDLTEVQLEKPQLGSGVIAPFAKTNRSIYICLEALGYPLVERSTESQPATAKKSEPQREGGTVMDVPRALAVAEGVSAVLIAATWYGVLRRGDVYVDW